MTKKRTTIQFGTFEVHDGIIAVGDPCYSRVQHITKIQAKNGKYNAYAIMSDEGDWGVRVAELIAIHEDDDYTPLWEDSGEYLGVDSGTMGIFDNEYHYDHHYNEQLDEDWYDRTVMEMDSFLITDNDGAIASSGYGDGSYPMEVVYDRELNDDTTVCAVKVIFIEKENED